MNNPDLMAELAEAVRLLDDMQSWIGPRRPDARDAEEREQWDQIERAKTTLRTHHAELEAMARDAARYRWLRNAGIYDGPAGSVIERWLFDRPTSVSGLVLDQAIDDAMRAEGGE